MIRTLINYAIIYREHFSTCVAEASSYRVNFALSMIMEISFYFISFGAIHLIFNQVDQIGPWNKDQFLFFLAFILLVQQFHMVFLSINFWEFSDLIKQGNLDFLLIKPVNGLFLVFFRFIRVAGIPNIFIMSGVLIYFGININLSILSWVLLLPLVLSGLCLISTLEIFLAMANFWMIEGSGINFLRMQFQLLSRWPDFIFKFYFKKAFTVAFPILLVSSAPVKFLIDHSQWVWLIALFTAIAVFWILIYFLWNLGLKQYESASS